MPSLEMHSYQLNNKSDTRESFRKTKNKKFNTEAFLRGFAGLFLITRAMEYAQLSVKPEAFGKTKTYGFISIMTTPRVTSNVGNGGDAGFSLTGLSKSAGKDTADCADSGKIFKETVPLVVKAFQENKNFKLMTESIVLKSKPMGRPKVLIQRNCARLLFYPQVLTSSPV
jgi:hypothetical protein